MLKLIIYINILIVSLWSIECKDLSTNKEIKDFFIKTHKSNPILKENITASLDMITKDNGKKENISFHLLKLKDKKRVYFTKGQNINKCTIRKGDKTYLCNECNYNSSTICRNYKTDDSITRIKNTNIDTYDFDILQSDDFISNCNKIKKNKNYIKIISTNQNRENQYNKVVSYYDKNKNVPIIINYYSQNTLVKVYRFFPKYYKKIDNEWVSTVSRVRSVNGSEKRFSFETLTYVKKDIDNNYFLYTQPADDPLISRSNINQLFNTNR